MIKSSKYRDTIQLNKIIVGLIFVALFLTSCRNFPEIPTNFDEWKSANTPPNGIRLLDNFYCDQSEHTNFHWLEYQYWTKRTYGYSSPEHKKTFINDTIWVSADTCIHNYDDYYLFHAAYRDYPLVGVTQAQAIAYSKWRGDRVFEYMLVKYGIIEFDTLQGPDDHFTIERYFKGEIKKLNEDLELTYYPEFRLPTLEERTFILTCSDSLTSAYFADCKRKKCKELQTRQTTVQCGISPCNFKDPINTLGDGDFTRKVDIRYSKGDGDLLFDLRGNVAEWLIEPNITVGGSWRDSLTQILQADTNTVIYPNAWTGFRNVCEWKEWKKD